LNSFSGNYQKIPQCGETSVKILGKRKFQKLEKNLDNFFPIIGLNQKKRSSSSEPFF